MQGLADGYFVLPCTVPDYIASTKLEPVAISHPAFADDRGRGKKPDQGAAFHQWKTQPPFVPQRTRQAHVG